jgi:hypothetical protein
MNDEPTIEQIAAWHVEQAAEHDGHADNEHEIDPLHNTVFHHQDKAAWHRHVAQRLRALEAERDRLRELVANCSSIHYTDKAVTIQYEVDDTGCAQELHDTLLGMLPEAQQAGGE